MSSPLRAVLYARYSTDMQSEASIEDQHRVCERIAERHGFVVVARFHDAAISGGTTDRAGYQAMLTAARAGDFDVIIAEDTSRLWRNMAEQSPRLAELSDLGIHVVTHDLDTRQESSGLMSAVSGAMSEHYRKEIGRRTRRGLEGLARKQKSAGGRAYGYWSATESSTGERQLHPERADIVREIYARFVRGDSIRSIVTDLNVRRVPSPGAEWARKERANDALWRISAVHEMLKNELYRGSFVWNKSKWTRSAADSKKRRRIENPTSDWVVHQMEHLRIVDDETWRVANAKLTERAHLFGVPKGGKIKYLLSGLLRCGVCGGAFIVATHRPVRYGCGTRKAAGDVACSNRLYINTRLAEERILVRVVDEMLSPDAVELGVRTIHGLAAEDASAPSKELQHIDAQIAELERLKREGILAPAIAGAALAKARKDRQKIAPQHHQIGSVSNAEAEYRAVVSSMTEALTGDDIPAARAALRTLLGEIQLLPDGSAEATQVNWSGSGGSLRFQFTDLVSPISPPNAGIKAQTASISTPGAS